MDQILRNGFKEKGCIIDMTITKTEYIIKERFDKTRAKSLLNCDQADEQQKALINKLITNADKSLTLVRKGQGSRFYPKSGRISMAMVQRELRNYIQEPLGIDDVDMVKALLSITRSYCNTCDPVIPCPKLNELLTNYEARTKELTDAGIPLREFGDDYKDKGVKANWNALFFGRYLQSWLQNWEFKRGDFEFLDEFDKECKHLVKSILADFPEYKEQYKKDKSKDQNADEQKILGTCFFWWYCDREVKIVMETAVKYMEKHNHKINQCEYDGLKIFKDSSNPLDLDALSAFVKDQTNYDIQFSIKPMEYPTFTFESDEDTGDKSKFNLLLDIFFKWAEDNKLYRVKKGSNIKTIQYNPETPYWAADLYDDVETLTDAFCLELGKDIQYLTRHSADMIKNLRKFITTVNDDPNFPVVNYNFRYFGYKDGLFDIIDNNFIPKADAPEKIFCRNYFDVPFERKIPEIFNQTIDYQDELTDKTKSILKKLLGRAYFPIGTLDKLPLGLNIKGLGGCGKSTILNSIQGTLRPDAVEISDSGASEAFKLEGTDGGELMIIGDGSDTLPFKPDQYKVMLEGKTVKVNQKGIAQKNKIWTMPILAALNEFMDFKDTSGAIMRRIVYVIFNKKLGSNAIDDKTLEPKLKAEYPYLVPYLVNEYHTFLKELEGKGDFWNVDICGQQILDVQAERKEETDPFEAYLSRNKLNTGKSGSYFYKQNDAKTNLQTFKTAFRNFQLLDMQIPAKDIKIDDNALQAKLKLLGMEVKELHMCKICGKALLKSNCDDPDGKFGVHYDKANGSKKKTINHCVLIKKNVYPYDPNIDG